MKVDSYASLRSELLVRGRLALRLCFVLLLTLLCAVSLTAQSISIFDVDASAFPAMEAKFYAFDATGQHAAPQAAQLLLTENAITIPILSVNCPIPTLRPISAVLTIDASGSMEYGSGPIKNMDIAKAAAHAWTAMMASEPGECAITSFDDQNVLRQDFTSNRTSLDNAIAALNAGGGTDYNKGLLDSAAGALQIANRGRFKKVIVFLTDGQSENANEAAIIAEAQRQSCVIYVVTLRMACPAALRNISEQTGGGWFENVATEERAATIYRTIFHRASGAEPCSITWQASPCVDGSRALTLAYLGAKDATTYRSPDSAAARLDVMPPSVFFFSKPLGIAYDTLITITAVNGSFNIADIVSTNAAYRISPRSFFLASGQSRSLTVTYTPSDSGYTWTTFDIKTDVCDAVCYASAGSQGKAPLGPTLHLDAPNGGEQLPVGSKALITWSGIPPTDNVKLDYSIDSARTWLRIVDVAWGGEYLWSVPNTPSTRCLVRVRRLQDGADASGLVHTLKAGDKWVRPAQWSPDGALVATTGDTPMLKIWDAVTGKIIHDLPTPTKGLYAVEWSPEGTRVAVTGHKGASFDSGYVAIWNALTGTLIHDLPERLASPTIAWSSDGAMLAASALGNIWQTSNGLFLSELIRNGINSCITWNPDNTQLASASYLGVVVWNLATQDTMFLLSGNTVGGRWAKWNEDGDRIATSFNDSTLHLWDGMTGAHMASSGNVGDVIGKFEWSPEGRRILGMNSSRCATVWDGETLAELYSLDCGAYLWSACWSPNGRMIATGSWQHQVVVWDAQTGKRIQEFEGHYGSVTGVQFSPDNRFLLTSATDGTARIWRLDDVPAMIDSSDAVFAIVAPTPDAMNVDMGRVVVGGSKDSVVAAFVRNTGTFAYDVDSITIVNGPANVFGVVSGAGPYTIGAGTQANTEFHFRPPSVGLFNAEIAIYTAGDTILRTIVGEGVPPALEVVNALLDFGQVFIGTTKSENQYPTIKNISTMPIAITGVRMVGPNVFDFTCSTVGQGFVLPPGGTAQLADFGFTPAFVGRTSGAVAFDYAGVGSPAIMQLFGDGILDPSKESATSTIEVGSARGRTGDIINIAITVTADSNLANTSATSFTGQLRFNATLLEPLSPLVLSPLQGNDGLVDVQLPLPPDTNGVLAVLQFRAALGNDSVTSLTLENVQAVGGNVVVTSVPGEFTLEGICYAGGARLLNPNGTISLSNVSPNPIVNGTTEVTLETVEVGETALILRDMCGRIVRTFFDGRVEWGRRVVILDVRDVSTGTYMLTLRTPTEQQTVRLEIAR